MEKINRLIENIERVFVGERTAVELALTALIAGGHLLIVDLPGLGKTTLAKAVARSIHGVTRRLQFTPDLLPSDVTGVNIYIHETGSFRFHPGPVFTNILLADEINRATPRAQSSLLEAMEEGNVSVDGVTHHLDDPFMVIATQNPIEVQGTFPLPEAQLDRFLISLSIGYPTREQENRIISERASADPLESLAPVLDLDDVKNLKTQCRDTHIDTAVRNYILNIAEATRRRDEFMLGASPRASLSLMRAAQARALLQGRDFVTPEDVKILAGPVLAHRIMLRTATRLNLENNSAVVAAILAANGITSLRQIAAFTAADIAEIGPLLPVYPQRITDDHWVDQARDLITRIR